MGDIIEDIINKIIQKIINQAIIDATYINDVNSRPFYSGSATINF